MLLRDPGHVLLVVFFCSEKKQTKQNENALKQTPGHLATNRQHYGGALDVGRRLMCAIKMTRATRMRRMAILHLQRMTTPYEYRSDPQSTFCRQGRGNKTKSVPMLSNGLAKHDTRHQPTNREYERLAPNTRTSHLLGCANQSVLEHRTCVIVNSKANLLWPLRRKFHAPKHGSPRARIKRQLLRSSCDAIASPLR